MRIIGESIGNRYVDSIGLKPIWCKFDVKESRLYLLKPSTCTSWPLFRQLNAGRFRISIPFRENDLKIFFKTY